MWVRTNLIGAGVLDREGRMSGTVEGTRPADGSDPEFAVVRLVCGERVLVPVGGVSAIGRVVQFPYGIEDIAAAPGPDAARFDADAVVVARAYWGMHLPEFDRIAFGVHVD